MFKNLCLAIIVEWKNRDSVQPKLKLCLQDHLRRLYNSTFRGDILDRVFKDLNKSGKARGQAA